MIYYFRHNSQIFLIRSDKVLRKCSTLHNTVVPDRFSIHRFSIHRFSRNPDLVEHIAVTNHFYSIEIQYSRKFDLVD